MLEDPAGHAVLEHSGTRDDNTGLCGGGEVEDPLGEVGELERVCSGTLSAVVHEADAALVDVEVLARHAAAEPEGDVC